MTMTTDHLAAEGRDWRIEGSIYDGFAAAISNGERTIAHVVDYGDACTLLSALARLDRMTEALNGIVSGDIPRPVANHWRRDCKPSKHDQCAHQRSMWEDCGNCVSDFAARALGGQVGEG